MGQAIREIPREALVLSSKVFWPTMPGPNGRGLSRKHMTESLHASLKRVNTDYLDLYFCHRYDPDTPIEEVVWTMNHFIQQGKILYWGTSEWEPAQIMEAIGVAQRLDLIPPSMEQPQYNLFHRRRVENNLAPICRDQGLGLTTFSPLYYGILTGKYNEGIPDGSRAALDSMAWMRDRITPARIQAVRQLSTLAEEIEMTPAQLALAWILRRKEVSSVITGATSPEQLDENLAAAELQEHLTEEIIDEIFRVIGPVEDTL
jgi:aryl-alcohol dehydrogenase-like predicted oxidoreductase